DPVADVEHVERDVGVAPFVRIPDATTSHEAKRDDQRGASHDKVAWVQARPQWQQAHTGAFLRCRQHGVSTSAVAMSETSPAASGTPARPAASDRARDTRPAGAPAAGV